MNAIEYGQTLSKAEEMMRDERHVSKLMDIQRSKLIYNGRNPDDYDVIDFCKEILVEGTVEYNYEHDGYQVVGLYASNDDGEQIDLSDDERQRATYLLISAYFEEVWG